MLSSRTRAPTRAPHAHSPASLRPAPPVLEQAGQGLRLILSGVAVRALPEGALYVEGARALVVSDLHLEKGSAFAVRGQMLPPYDTRFSLARLAALIEALAPEIVVSLGDSFHDREAGLRLHGEDRAALSALTARTDWVWIEGNHDPEPPRALGGRAAREITLAGLAFRHEPAGGQAHVYGHLHPCARVAARGASVRRRCFATDGARLVMPAFGAFAGGLNVRDAAFAPVFPAGCYALVLGQDRLYPAAPNRLAPDL